VSRTEPGNLVSLLTFRSSLNDVDWSGLDWDNMGIDWASAYAAGQHTSTSATPVATPLPDVTPAAAAGAAAPATTHTKAPAAAAGAVFSELGSLFEGVVGVANGRTSFGEATAASGVEGDNYFGNVGKPYGSNVMLVDSPSGYPFTNTFSNPQSKSITVNLWQKVGPDGRPLSGSALAPSKTTLTFVLAPGEAKTVAFQANTQVAWAEACSEKIASGAFATSWGELNVKPSGSGYDLSAIVNPGGNNYNMAISSVESTCISDTTQNYWTAVGGVPTPIGTSDGSCFIAQSTATVHTVMGGFAS